ncbi:MAG TPA: indolepyruvate oxidoreductase subunit beta family protein [Steroidobacteraceae bacterium]|nr:indolepyruvate oxidoreductase subunit beta family protein [Steroidobacteraceae bacterium]
MNERTIKLTIAALGGQGGGVLADWLIEIAEFNDYLVQSTSVPGVAQRTGATIYYLEFFPRAAALLAGHEPVMALVPAAGDVDCVVASELAEAGRAIQRGLVTPGCTTVIASTHRSYSIVEKSALGDGRRDDQQLTDLLRECSKRSILFDMEETAGRHQAVISAVMLGAICGSGVLPFPKASFEQAITRSALSVKTNLSAFEDADRQARAGGAQWTISPAPTVGPVPQQSRTPALQPLLDRVRELPKNAQALALEGVRRMLDYQDRPYAALYLARLERVAVLEHPASGAGALSAATARSLALWMSFEDTMRVAQQKTRGARFARVRAEVRAAPGQPVGITEFMKPRVQEIAGTLPAALGRWLLASPRIGKFVGRWTHGRRIRTDTVCGFLLLYTLAAARRWRRSTLRFRQEDERIGAWLGHIIGLAPDNYEMAVELARAQRLIKGYGETHEKGWRNFCRLVGQVDVLRARADGAQILARLQSAALADEEGAALDLALSDLSAEAVVRSTSSRLDTA